MQYTKDDGADNRSAQDTTVMNKAGRKDKKPSWVMFGITTALYLAFLYWVGSSCCPLYTTSTYHVK